MPYGIAGSGAPVLFLHGFGLAPRTYAAAVERLAAVGVRVYAPALPGFGGTGACRTAGTGSRDTATGRPLPRRGRHRRTGPVVGHSFGGGVALASAHARVDGVSQLVLVNSVGGGAWSPSGTVREIRHRPLCGGVRPRSPTRSSRDPGSAIASIAGDSLRNAVRDPAALWRIGELARSADLRAEAAQSSTAAYRPHWCGAVETPSFPARVSSLCELHCESRTCTGSPAATAG
ncbi:alpha/beta fold hydrolase [Rhodococcus hoagii]|nr:alpha/beta fold hydrolase [Prescottella equi]